MASMLQELLLSRHIGRACLSSWTAWALSVTWLSQRTCHSFAWAWRVWWLLRATWRPAGGESVLLCFVIVTNTAHKLFSLSCLIYLFFSPRFEPVGFPLSVHVYFYDDRFQGYLVRQEVQAVESKARETLEMWAVPQATLVLEKNLKEFERLKNLEVSTL